MPAPAMCIDPLFHQRIAEMPAPTARNTKAFVADVVLHKFTNVATPRQEFRDNAIRQVSNAVTGHTPRSFANNNGAGGREMSSASVVRKLPSTNDQLSKTYTAERVSFALQAWGKERASPIKSIQRLTGVSRKAAEAWWHGTHQPMPNHLFTLARKIPELKAEVARLLELEQDAAESFQREAIALLQRYAR